MFEERDKKKCSDDLRTVSQLRPGESVFPLPLNLCFFVFLHTAEIFAAKKIGWANEREERGQTEKRSRSLSLFTTTRSVNSSPCTNPVFPYVSSTLHCCLSCRDLTDHTPHLVRENLIGYILIALYVSCTQRWLVLRTKRSFIKVALRRAVSV